MIVHSSVPVTLVGGAKTRLRDITTALNHAPDLVAVDGGAGAVLKAGLSPLAVIGDMDSLQDDAAAAFADVLRPVTEQETTDFDKTLRNISAPLVIAVGVTGGRLDHELAVMHTLVWRSAQKCVVLGAESIVFVCPPAIRLHLPKKSVFSLFPMGPVGVRSQGLRWPTEGLAFAPDSVIGTSNEVTGPVHLSADASRMLIILPRRALSVVVQGLLEAPNWPQDGRAEPFVAS